MSLYEQLGGQAGITAITTAYYANIAADPTVAGKAKGIDDGSQIINFAAFLSAALGGPNAWNGKSLKEVHGPMGVTNAQFAASIEHLRSALVSYGVAEPLVDQTIAVAETVRYEIVSA